MALLLLGAVNVEQQQTSPTSVPRTCNALPDNTFPPKEVHNESLDLWSTDREFFVTAKVLAETDALTEIEATIWNRSRWPSRTTNQLSFRYYFTQTGEVIAALANAGMARVSAMQTTPGGQRYVEVLWPGEVLHHGTHETNSRHVRLTLRRPEWKGTDDWSHATLDRELRIVPHLPVYQAGKKVGGDEPQ